MNKAFLDYYRCPPSLADFRLAGPPHLAPLASGQSAASVFSEKDGAARIVEQLVAQASTDDAACVLPFNPTEVAEHLRRERYVAAPAKTGWKAAVRKLYYALRPAFPVALRRHLQKAWLKGWEKTPFPRWPVDRTVDQIFETLMRLAIKASGGERIPFIWFWPQSGSGCAIMTHDVETESGLRFAGELMDINDSYQVKSSFQLIPEARYAVTKDDLSGMKSRGFEVNVHDLKHDGHLFDDREKFVQAAARINQHALAFESTGFRSAILYRNQDWYSALQVSYDMSVPNVGHLDPQRGGCCTVMPYFVGDVLELPVTATQDYTLFHVLESHSIELWREQIRLIMEQHGLISFIVHPDYLDTGEARRCYQNLLAYLSELRKNANLWIALPGEVDQWWRQRNAMKLVQENRGWRIEGPGAERAVVAYATLKEDKVVYEFE